MIRNVFCVFMLVAVFSMSVAMADNTDKEKAAVSAAERWLAMVDEGKYAESWKKAAAYFRSSITQNQWEQSLQGVRSPLGKRISRKVQSINYKTSLPGAPDGEYVVVQFETSFTNKKSAIETVTPVREKDGRWRVSGYYIK